MKNMFLIYVGVMIFVAGIFLGNEISMMQTDSRLSHANNRLKQCVEVITRNR